MSVPPPDNPHTDDLATLLTRPTAPGGVPFILTFVATGAVMLFTLIMRNPGWALLLGPIWGFLKWRCSKDLHIGNVIAGWMAGAASSSHRFTWGGSTVSPLSPKSKNFGMFDG